MWLLAVEMLVIALFHLVASKEAICFYCAACTTLDLSGLVFLSEDDAKALHWTGNFLLSIVE